jgi:integrase
MGPISKSILANCKKLILQVFKFAIGEGILLPAEDPGSYVEMSTGGAEPVETPLIPWEKLVDALEVTYAKKDKRDYLILQCGFGLGLRPSETCALRVNDVKIGTLVIDEGVVENEVGEVKTRGSKRTVVLPTELESEFRNYIAANGLNDNDFLFTYGNREPISQNNYVKRQLNTIGKQIGYPDLDFRQRRTAYSSYAAEQGTTPKDLQRALGHSSPEFSQRVYQKPLPETLIKMQEGYHKKMNEGRRRKSALTLKQSA